MQMIDPAAWEHWAGSMGMALLLAACDSTRETDSSPATPSTSETPSAEDAAPFEQIPSPTAGDAPRMEAEPTPTMNVPVAPVSVTDVGAAGAAGGGPAQPGQSPTTSGGAGAGGRGLLGTGGTAGSPGAGGDAGGLPDTARPSGGAGGVSAENEGTAGASSGGGGGTSESEPSDCMTPPPAGPLLGWASEGGGTSGGGDQLPMVISDTGELRSAIGGSDARVIHVAGVHRGAFVIGSNKTIVGLCGAEMNGDIHINDARNVIFRNIKVVGHDCSDSPGDCGGGEDAITVNSSSHLWFDHLDVSDGSDGNLDITQGSDYITISWTRFSYSTARTDSEQGESGHRFSNLIGSSDRDVGEYRITFHHNWWAQNVDQRMPRTRFGDVHVVNNLFTAAGNNYCTNAGIDSRVLVENNVYQGVNNPLSPDDNGDMRAVGNLFPGTTGNQSDNGGSGFTPPYDYPLDDASVVEELVRNGVGPQ